MKFFQELTKLEKALLAILGVLIFICGCLLLANFIFRNSSNNSTLPAYQIGDVADNGRTNVAYFLVADKNLTKDDAEKIIQYYTNMHIKQKDYKLINIWIFCDKTYAYYEALNEPTITDNQFYSHVIYWYQTGEMSTEGLIFITEPTVDYPTFGSACR